MSRGVLAQDETIAPSRSDLNRRFGVQRSRLRTNDVTVGCTDDGRCNRRDSGLRPTALEQQGTPGLSVAITDRTHTIAIITQGMADVASKTPVNADTRFPIGSISKSMTALALLQLRDKGLVNLNARVQQYLPSWSIHSTGGPVLVHQLLSHTSGTPDDYTFQQYGFAIAALRDAHTLFPPGTAWSYSNDGFGTIGAIVANVSHNSWQSNIENHVFAPLGMENSLPVFNDRTLSPPTATGYQFRDADYVAAPPHPALIPSPFVDFVDPAGSVISTPGDMAAYIRFYLNGGKAANGSQLLAPATFAAMTSADHFNNGAPDAAKHVELAEWPAFYHEYGYGLSVFDTNGDRLVGHTGGVSGYTACFQANLSRGFGVIALSNLVEAPLHPCAIVKYAMEVLRAQSLGQALPPPPAGPPIAPPKIAANDYVGTYRSADGAGVVVADDNGALALHDGAKSYQLVAADRDIFWTDDPRFTIFYVAFERNKAKAVDGFTNGSSYFVNGEHRGPDGVCVSRRVGSPGRPLRKLHLRFARRNACRHREGQTHDRRVESAQSQRQRHVCAGRFDGAF